MTTRFLTILVLLTTFSCLTDKKDDAIFDPVLVYQDLTINKLEKTGFKKVTLDSKVFYIVKDDFREIKYEIQGDEIASRTYKIKYEDLDKLIRMYDGEIISRHEKDDFIKLRIREKEVMGEVIRTLNGKYIEIFTDWFHIVIKN